MMRYIDIIAIDKIISDAEQKHSHFDLHSHAKSNHERVLKTEAQRRGLHCGVCHHSSSSFLSNVDGEIKRIGSKITTTAKLYKI